MNSHPLVEDYLRWLAPQIRDENDGLSNPNREFWGLLTVMFQTQFAAPNPNDDNRMVDGKDLRTEFCYAQHIRVGSLADLGPASFLEVLIGLSKRMTFNAGRTSAPGWAWILLSNLGLHRMYDPLSRAKARRVNDILEQCIWRQYAPDGRGGFFPLRDPREDQRNVEIWYQMSAYIAELR